jgi:ATP-dependent exoDNAse (exonuclease V) beta subunit
MKVARENASVFIRKMNPSGLPREEAAAEWMAEEIVRPAAATPALRYGVWWHEFAQRLPWNSEMNSWEEIFETSKSLSPEPARSQREWEMLRAHLAESSNLLVGFADGLVHQEMPFLWRIDATKCLEGIVDLAFFEGDGGKGLILDWKTNRIAPEKIDSLREKYRAQIASYWQAVTQLTGASIDAGIFSTSTGQFVIYDRAELAREWDRLAALPMTELEAAVAAD